MKKHAPALLLIALLCLGTLLCLGEGASGAFASPLHSYVYYVPLVYGGPKPEPMHGAGVSCVDKHDDLGMPCSEDCIHVEALVLEWTHGWQLNPTVCPGVEAVPQISHNSEIGQPLGGSSDWVIYLNEPEYYQRYDMDAEYSATGLHLVLITYPGIKVLLPSASVSYLDAMWNHYVHLYGEPPSAERLGISHHCYGWGYAEQAIEMCTYLAEQVIAWGLERGIDEVWITEFGMDPYWHDGMDGTKEFMRGMVAVYQANPYVTRYAWFQKNPTAWVWTSGELGLWMGEGPTELGELYTELGGQYHANP